MAILVFSANYNAYFWVLCTEKYFKVKNVPEHEKMVLAARAMSGRALKWWRWWSPRHPETSWDNFATLLLWRFNPDYRAILPIFNEEEEPDQESPQVMELDGNFQEPSNDDLLAWDEFLLASEHMEVPTMNAKTQMVATLTPFPTSDFDDAIVNLIDATARKAINTPDCKIDVNYYGIFDFAIKSDAIAGIQRNSHVSSSLLLKEVIYSGVIQSSSYFASQPHKPPDLLYCTGESPSPPPKPPDSYHRAMIVARQVFDKMDLAALNSAFTHKSHFAPTPDIMFPLTLALQTIDFVHGALDKSYFYAFTEISNKTSIELDVDILGKLSLVIDDIMTTKHLSVFRLKVHNSKRTKELHINEILDRQSNLNFCLLLVVAGPFMIVGDGILESVYSNNRMTPETCAWIENLIASNSDVMVECKYGDLKERKFVLYCKISESKLVSVLFNFTNEDEYLLFYHANPQGAICFSNYMMVVWVLKNKVAIVDTTEEIVIAQEAWFRLFPTLLWVYEGVGEMLGSKCSHVEYFYNNDVCYYIHEPSSRELSCLDLICKDEWGRYISLTMLQVHNTNLISWKLLHKKTRECVRPLEVAVVYEVSCVYFCLFQWHLNEALPHPSFNRHCVGFLLEMMGLNNKVVIQPQDEYDVSVFSLDGQVENISKKELFEDSKPLISQPLEDISSGDASLVGASLNNKEVLQWDPGGSSHILWDGPLVLKANWKVAIAIQHSCFNFNLEDKVAFKGEGIVMNLLSRRSPHESKSAQGPQQRIVLSIYERKGNQKRHEMKYVKSLFSFSSNRLS